MFKKVVCVVFAIATFIVSAAPSINDYAKLPNVEFMSISPEGNNLAYIKSTEDSNVLYVISQSTLKSMGAVNLGDVEVEYVYFANENQVIIKTSRFSRIPGFRGKYHLKHAFVFDINTKVIKPLLKTGGVVYKGQTQLSSVLGLTQARTHVYMPAYTGQGSVEPKYSLLKVDLSAPSNPKAYGIGSPNMIDFLINKEGIPFIREQYINRTNTHTIEVLRDDTWVEIYKHVAEMREINLVGVSDDYQNLIVLSEDTKTHIIDYHYMSLKTGEITASNLGKSGSDISDVITDINRVVYGVVYSGFVPEYKFFNAELQKRFDAISAMLPEHSIELTSWTADFNSLVVYASGSSAPGDFYLFEKNKQPQYLATARSNIQPDDIHPIGQVTFKARDGLKIPTLITIPKKSVNKMENLPAVVLPHGGPASYDKIEFDWLAQAIAEQGYLVIQPQFRGSYGFGLEHKNAGYGEWGKKMQNDVTDAVKFFIKKGMINPEKVCIAGISYGGYAALAGGAYTPDLYSCVVSINGVADIPKMMSREEFDHGSDHWVVSYWNQIIASGDVNEKDLDSISPVFSAKNFSAPVLLLHSENDHVVRIEQSERMNKALKKEDKDVTFIEMEDGIHYLSSAAVRKQALVETIEFLNKHLQ